MDAKAETKSSYTYWVREATHQAAPAPVPRKLTSEELSISSQQAHLGSAWNQAGTWEERSLNSWAATRLKELLEDMGPIEFGDGSAGISKASCQGDATIVTVRNKKRVGYSYEINLDFRADILFGEFKDLKGKLKVPDASFGELDDLQLDISFTNEKDNAVPQAEEARLTSELKSFLPKIQEKLRLFEEELKMR